MVPWRPELRPQPTPNSVSLIGQGMLAPGVEIEIEKRVHEVAVKTGFSVADQVRYVHNSLCYIDFPHIDAANEFLQATGGSLNVGGESFKLQSMHPSGGGSGGGGGGAGGGGGGCGIPAAADAPAAATTSANEAEEAVADAASQPTDTLMVRHVGEQTETSIRDAFESFMPHIKSVKVPLNWAGKPKSFGFVQFHSTSEAETALSRFRAAGSMIGGRRVVAVYAQPSSEEDMVRQSALRKAENEKILENTQQALSGINGDMWASYLEMFKNGGPA